MKNFIKIKKCLIVFRILILNRYPIIKYNNTSWILNDDWERNITRRAKIAKRRGWFYQKEKGSIGKYPWISRSGQSGTIYLHHLSASTWILFICNGLVDFILLGWNVVLFKHFRTSVQKYWHRYGLMTNVLSTITMRDGRIRNE